MTRSSNGKNILFLFSSTRLSFSRQSMVFPPLCFTLKGKYSFVPESGYIKYHYMPIQGGKRLICLSIF